jgi:hypothetical protein
VTAKARTGALSLALLPLLPGCGARSLLADEPGGAGPASACPAAVEPGAPSRTFRSAASAPASPHVAWSVPIGAMQFIPTVAVARSLGSGHPRTWPSFSIARWNAAAQAIDECFAVGLDEEFDFVPGLPALFQRAQHHICKPGLVRRMQVQLRLLQRHK